MSLFDFNHDGIVSESERAIALGAILSAISEIDTDAEISVSIEEDEDYESLSPDELADRWDDLRMRNRLQTNIQCRGTVVSVLTLESLAPERYNKNSYSLRLKPTGGCLSLCRGIWNLNLFIRYAINKLRPVQSLKRKQTCRMTSLLQKTT